MNMKKTIASLFVGTCLLLSACSFTTTKSENALHIYSGPAAETMDPAKNSSAHGATYQNAVFEGLIRMNQKRMPEPGAAEKYEISEDGKTYTFHMRDNKWQNGDKVTAHDFAYSIRRTLAPETASSYAYMLYNIKNAEEYNSGKVPVEALGVKAIDDKTLEITLNAPTSYFLTILSHQTAFPVNKKVVESDPAWATKAESLIGNGAYKVTKWVKNNKLSLTKADTYWDAENIKTPNIDFYLLDSRDTCRALFENGELHYVSGPSKEWKEKLQKEDKLWETMGNKISYIAYNLNRSPFTDVRVRKALSYGFDRATISKVTFGEAPVHNAFSIVPPGQIDPVTGNDFRKEAGDLFKYDVPKAKELLAEAGYPDGKGFPTITLLYPTNESNKQLCEAIQAMFKKNLNIDIELRNQEWKVYINNRRNNDFDITVCFWSGDYPDPMTFCNLFVSGGPQNDGRYSNTEYDRLIALAANTGDEKIRRKAFHEAEQIIIDEMGILPMDFGLGWAAVNPKLKGVYGGGNGITEFRHAYLED